MCRNSDGNLFLVGGGIEGEESPKLALLRESIEETGHEIQIVEIIGKAKDIGFQKNILLVLNIILEYYTCVNY
ncbi:NUDIX domain-containing protein [Lysinibacillus sp. FSL W8-0953]|uniref:NUDIX domain-containing protein n=1 Tax=Lysinibacillus sp. FSL W8-0953 TaxID=2954640 RepID=UPI0030FC43DD